MAAGDLVQILEVPLTPDGQLDVAVFNTQFRQLQEKLAALEGRTQPSQIRDDLSVLGSVTVADGVSAETLALGDNTFTPTDPSLAPLLEDALAGRALTVSSAFGGPDLLGATSPLTWAVKDEFLGSAGGVGTEVGDLGWTLTGGSASDSGAVSHPGSQQFNSGGGVASATLGSLSTPDIRYFAAVVMPNGDTRLGLLATPGGAAESSSGIYFSALAASSAFWRTVTVNGGTTLAQNTTVTVDLAWFLLEIVVSLATGGTTNYVDFYINRARAFRHEGASLFDGAVFPTFAFESRLDVDRAVLCGQARTTVWT